MLLLFFPFAFSGVCTSELCSVRDSIGSYDNAKAMVIGISIDSLIRWLNSEENFSFLLLSDFNKEVSMKYEALHEQFSYGMKGVSKRAAFIIDKEGSFDMLRFWKIKRGFRI